MSIESRITVTVEPKLKKKTYGGSSQNYPAAALGNLLARRVGVNTNTHVINCKDPEIRAYFRGLCDAGMMYAAQILVLLDHADELHVSWEVDKPESPK